MSRIYRNRSRLNSIRFGTGRLIAFVLVFALLVGIPSILTNKAYAAPEMPVFYTSSSDIQDAKEEKEETEEALAQANSKIDALSGDIGEISAELEKLKGLSEEQHAQYLEIAEQLAAALLAKKAALNIYLETQETLKVKKSEFSERISVMFEFQNKSTLEILLESDSLAGFFTNMQIIELIGDSDNQIIEEMQAAMEDAQLKSDYALQESEEMQTVADTKQAELEELEAMIGKTEETLRIKQKELDDWQKKQDELEAESERIDAEIARLQSALYSGNNGGTSPYSGTMTWPYPGDYTIYSPYGWRYHPIWKVNRFHYGVDLGGVLGNPIVAAADGTVILVSAPWSGQNSGGTGYGNYVVIDHGGGVSTLYAHCKSIEVSVGDWVVAGQTIALCGSTGDSTGAHLHFEVRVNGSKVNPADYIT